MLGSTTTYIPMLGFSGREGARLGFAIGSQVGIIIPQSLRLLGHLAAGQIEI